MLPFWNRSSANQLIDVSEVANMATNRTTHRSKTGKKLYAVRGKQGKFKDIQSYKRAHGQDVRRKSKSERANSSAR
jgi:hypothetical protein